MPRGRRRPSLCLDRVRSPRDRYAVCKFLPASKTRAAVRWQKCPGNPVIRSDDSSGILVDDGERLRLYTMHPQVKLWLPRDSPRP